MGRTTVYLDAGYIDKVLHYDHANARLDFAKLAGEMAKLYQLLRAYYYHCLPYQSDPTYGRRKTTLCVNAQVYNGTSLSIAL